MCVPSDWRRQGRNRGIDKIDKKQEAGRQLTINNNNGDGNGNGNDNSNGNDQEGFKSRDYV
ncbi:hypothetical protein SAMD00023353_1302590 [Rosellinia necatrix]|uniref:Uncharacterized protein n=1 Tax=Rosellinia necatrix TaxID=77044 RepID=A0A1S8A6Z6_ROSNE|nr:hypothetical protein SAMD00023353_1302590 [Rosellinia necatrix]